MNPRERPILLLALGNDIMGDDGVALAAGRILRKSFTEDVDHVETPGADLALLEVMSGYDRVLLIDSIVTGRHPPGTVLDFTGADFDKTVGPSPHCAGLPEVLMLAELLHVDFPKEIRILAMEIDTPLDFRETLGPVVERALPGYVARAGSILRQWKEERARNLAHSESAAECSTGN